MLHKNFFDYTSVLTIAQRIWAIATLIVTPFLPLWLIWRRYKGKEESDHKIIAQRRGISSVVRPSGRLIWLHAASAGESLSALGLISALRAKIPDLHVLLTTGTVSSAQIIAKRKLTGVIHQYAPLDSPIWVKRFIDYWHPDMVIWVESEFWPNMLQAIRMRKIPAVLVNARMSIRSYARWRCIAGWIKEILSTFPLILAQSEEDATRFNDLGATGARYVGNLKYATSPLPVEAKELNALRDNIGGRPVWLMASTHQGEEEIAAEVHHVLAAGRPDLLTIIVPRHPDRANSIEKTLQSHSGVVARRTRGDLIKPDTNFYLADTMGETGIFYTISPVSCIGGSFTWGGHNPIEAAALNTTSVIFGPQMTNFAAIASAMLERDAAIQVNNKAELAAAVQNLLDDHHRATRLRNNAHQWAVDMSNACTNVMQEMDGIIRAVFFATAPTFQLAK